MDHAPAASINFMGLPSEHALSSASSGNSESKPLTMGTSGSTSQAFEHQGPGSANVLDAAFEVCSKDLRRMREHTNCDFFLVVRSGDGRVVKTASTGSLHNVDSQECVSALLQASISDDYTLIASKRQSSVQSMMPPPQSNTSGCMSPPVNRALPTSVPADNLSFGASRGGTTSSMELDVGIGQGQLTPDSKGGMGPGTAGSTYSGGMLSPGRRVPDSPATVAAVGRLSGLTQAILEQQAKSNASRGAVQKQRKKREKVSRNASNSNSGAGGRVTFNPSLLANLVPADQAVQRLGKAPGDKKILKHSLIEYLYAIYKGRVEYAHRPRPAAWPKDVEFKRPSMLKLQELRDLWYALPALHAEEIDRQAREGDFVANVKPAGASLADSSEAANGESTVDGNMSNGSSDEED